MPLPTIPLQFGNFTNALASGTQARYYSQRADTEAAEEQRKKEAQQHVDPAIKGDPAAMGKLAYGDPKAAVAISTALQRMDTNQRAKVKEQADYSAQSSHAILQANPADRPALYQQHYQEGVRRGYDMSSLPPTYSPQIDGRLRSAREMAIPVVEWFKQNKIDARHASPGGGAGGELTPIATPGAPAAAPSPAPASPGRPMSSVMPSAAPPTTVAQAPQPQDDAPVSLAADPSIKTLPQRSGPIFYEDPTQHGYTMAQDRRKPGQPVIDEHGIRYIHPQTKEVVIFKPEKPQANRSQAPAGFRWNDSSGLDFIPGGPADPSIAKRASPMNNEQARDAGFADRMQTSNGLLSQLDTQGTRTWQRLAEMAGKAGNFAQDEQYQEFRQAKADFINAQLRRESGAAISPDEFRKADEQYFPQPGDKPGVITQKSKNRQLAVEAMIRGGGPSYQPSPSVGTPAKPEPSKTADPLEGKTATNPATGAKIIRRGGQWVPQ